MPDPRDDFSAFAGSEHMLFGLPDPFGFMRDKLEQVLCERLSSTRLESIRCQGEPRFLTVGHQAEDDSGQLVVTHCATCFQCVITVERDAGQEQLRSTVTLCRGELDQPEDEQRSELFLHVSADAAPAFEEAAFTQRFLEFRRGTLD
jgi:hypothetical protein